MTSVNNETAPALLKENQDSRPGQYRYWAFLSYSRLDEKWGIRIHRYLERYRLPRTIVEHAAPVKAVPKRLFPVFRDREELRTAPDLSESLELALQQSRCLVVLCSPASAKSEWVNYEITRFKQLGRSHAIHYIIIGGDTHPDSPDFCFPHTAITTQSGEVSVPLAADARAQGDGFRDAILKVIAGILDLDFDKLRRRDERRKVRRAMLLATLSFSLTVAFSVITYLAVQAENKAVKQARVATSRSLAASALNLQQREDVAMLMALEALRIDKTSEAKASLMQIVASTPVIRYLRGHARPATAITSTPKYIITGGRDGELFVWHADHYEIIANLSGAHQTRITALASSRDGHLFASADLNGLIIIWRAGDLKQVAAFKHGYGAVWDLDFGPGHVLASGGDDRHVNFWDDKAQWLGGGAFHLGAISVVRFDASGKRLVSAAQDGSFVVWDTYNVKASSIGRDNHAYGIEAADFSDDGNTLITAGDELILWNTSVSPPTMIKEFETRVGVNQIILDNTGGTALLAGETGFVDVYDLSTGQSMALRFKKHRGIVEDFAVLSDLRVVSSARDDVAGAVVWRRPDIRQFPQALFLSTRLPTGVLSSAILGDLILSVGGDGGFTVLSYDFNSRLINTLFQAPGSAAIDQVFTVNDQRFVARHKDGTLSLWSLDATNQRIEKINELAAAADAVAVHPGGDYVVALNNRGVHFYNLPNFKLRSTNNATTNNVTPNNVTTSLPKSVAFNTSGNRMALADRDGVLVWDMTSNRLVERLYTNDAPIAFAISPDGATMAWSNASNDIVLWPVEESAAPIPLSGHVEAVYQLEFSPDGTLLVSADALGGVKLWDVAQQRQITNLELHRDTLTSFAISPEGETLLSATISGDMAVTSLSLPSWINATCRILDRNMTPDEWKRFGFGEYKRHCDTVQKIPPPNTTPPAKPQAPPKPIVVSKGYDVVEDATGTISVMVPSQWKARDIGPLANGGLLYSRIRAAPSMQEYLDMQGPGLDFALLKLDKPETVNLRSLLELVMEQSSRCDNWAGNSIFNNAMFSGTMSFMRPCGTTGLTEVWLAARTSNNVIIIGSLAVTGDEDAWVHIINAMNSLKTL